MPPPSLQQRIRDLRMLAANVAKEDDDVNDRLTEACNALEEVADIFQEFLDALAPLGR